VSISDGVKVEMQKRSNILVFGQFTNNRGDQAQGVALAYKIRDLLPEVKVTYIYFQHDFPVHPECEFIENRFVSVRRAFVKSLVGFFTFRSNNDQILSLIRNADIIVMPPGGPYIGDMYEWETELYRAACFFYAKLCEKKTMIYAPSMGPFNHAWRNILHRYIIRKADVVCVRDRISKDWADKLQTGKDIHLTADSAIQRILSPGEIEEQICRASVPLPPDRMKVGMTPIDLTWHPTYGKDIALNTRLISEVTRVIKYLIERKNAVIYFYPQLYGTQSDIQVIERIMAKVRDDGAGFGDSMFVLDPLSSSDYQQAYISKMNLFIGARYHSLVFSAMYHIPFIGFRYEHKTEDLVNRLNMDQYCLPINNIDAKIIIGLIEEMVSQEKDIKIMLGEKIRDLHTLALTNTLLLHGLYRESNR
jgi:polysaccharide pyruvyl transferase WcaK-like protein